MADKENKVTLIIARHDDARSQDITAYGAAYAYLTGKFSCDMTNTYYPDHIFYSPVARTRNTAKMHQLAMKINDICEPTMSYDARFHEDASEEKTLEALDDALLYAKAQGFKTIEIVGHEPTLLKLMRKFNNSNLSSKFYQFDYGGHNIIKANSWDDLMQGKRTRILHCESSKNLARGALGYEQSKVLDALMYEGKTSGRLDLTEQLAQAKEQINKAIKWVAAKEAGQETEEKYSPAEFLEILDAYKFWGANMMTSVGIAPDEKNPFYSDLQQLLFGEDTYFNKKFLAEYNVRSEEKIDNSEASMPYPVFNAVAKMVAQRAESNKKFDEENEQIANEMEDFPVYRDVLSAGEERRIDDDKEVKGLNKATYRVTQKEQIEHDKIADIVQNFKANQR